MRRRDPNPKLSPLLILAFAWGCSSAPLDGSSDAGTGGTGAVSAGGARADGGSGGNGEAVDGGGLAGGGASDGAGGDPTGGSTFGGGGTSGGGGSASGGGAPGGGGFPVGTCGPDPPLEVLEPAVEISELIDTPLPPPQGGPLVDGIYDATTQVYYGDFNLDNVVHEFRQVMRVRDGGTMLDMLSISGTARSYGFSVEPSGSDLMMTQVCPTPVDVAGPQPYTASPGQLQFYVDYGSVTAIVTHVLRD